MRQIWRYIRSRLTDGEGEFFDVLDLDLDLDLELDSGIGHGWLQTRLEAL